MEYIHINRENLKDYIKNLLGKLEIEQEKKSLGFALQFGYLAYIRLFIESSERADIQKYFPYAGFPMEWFQGEEDMDSQQRMWQLSYQMQYCASIVEPGHFMEEAQLVENSVWVKELCKFVDWLYEHAVWGQGIPEVFPQALEEILHQIYEMGNSDIFLTPEPITHMMVKLIEKQETGKIWNPSCRTGEFLTAFYKEFPQWEIQGSESEKEEGILAQMLLFYSGAGDTGFIDQAVLQKPEHSIYDRILSNLPVGEGELPEKNDFPISTRKIQLQYLQQIMAQLKETGQAVVIVTEGTLFKFDAERKVREYLVEGYALQGVISLPADAFLPYTGSKASILIFGGRKVKKSEYVWFYELENPGYTLDKFRETTDYNQIPSLLSAWEDRKEKEKSWLLRMQEGVRKNQWDNPVPETWEEKDFWFADLETIRKNDYNLTAGRYKPWKEIQEQTMESPYELLQQLTKMEQETMEQMKELLEMTKNYE